ncbi:hypothetical protein [Streptomyces sp. UNOB3_S3]|nr:hypothetical protein [Streptomyces sp. UNOB3_S3]
MEETILQLQELPAADEQAQEPWMCCDTAETSYGILNPPHNGA